MLNEKQIKQRIWELNKEIEILQYVLNHTSEGMGRPLGSYKYTPEQINFLKECEKNELTDKEVIDLFNIRFGTSLSKSSRRLYNFMCRTGIKKPKMEHIPFTDSEDNFIKENLDKMKRKEIALKLDRTRDSLKNRIVLLNRDKNIGETNNEKQ